MLPLLGAHLPQLNSQWLHQLAQLSGLELQCSTALVLAVVALKNQLDGLFRVLVGVLPPCCGGLTKILQTLAMVGGLLFSGDQYVTVGIDSEIGGDNIAIGNPLLLEQKPLIGGEGGKGIRVAIHQILQVKALRLDGVVTRL